MLDKAICHFRGVGSNLVLLFIFFMENPFSKHCRCRSDATLCGILFGSSLFFCDPFTSFPGKNGLTTRPRRPISTVETLTFSA